MVREKLTLKERFIYRIILGERIYKHWYTRFLITGVNLDRIRRVIARIKNFNKWCSEWAKEGEWVENLANEALSNGNIFTARYLFREAAACYHIGQHIYFLDIEEKLKVQEKARENFKRAIALYDESHRPIRIEIPFHKTTIPGYLKLTNPPNNPLIIIINGLDNIKEIENQYLANFLTEFGLNVFAFDGPGSGEMWKNMKMIPNYEQVITAIIDWFEHNNDYKLNLTKIGTFGMSFGGYLAPYTAAYEKRISCVVGNGGLGYLKKESKKINPIWIRDFLFVTGCKAVEEALDRFGALDIKKAPPLDRPLLFIQGGQDKIIPNPKLQADYIMEWAIGEKELKYYPDGEHCCSNYFDEVLPYSVDWLKKHLLR